MIVFSLGSLGKKKRQLVPFFAGHGMGMILNFLSYGSDITLQIASNELVNESNQAFTIFRWDFLSIF